MFNVKLAATLMVALMMFSGAAVMVGTEDNDAVTGVNYAFGSGINGAGQMATGDTTNISTFHQIDSSYGNIVKLATTTYTTYFINDQGELFGVGSNQAGQFADGSTTNKSTPVQIGASLGPIKDVFCKSNTMWLLTQDGHVYAAGYNTYGQFGDGSSSSSAQTSLKACFTTIGEVKTIVPGSKNCYVLTSDDKLYSVGNNEFGQIGNGVTGSSSSSVSNPYLVASDVLEVKNAGYSNTETVAYLTKSGGLYAFGANTNNQISAANTSPVNTPTQIASSVGTIIDFAVDGYTIYVLNSDLELFACGSNYYGQFGDGTTTSSTAFTKIAISLGDISSFYISQSRIVVISDNKAYFAGYSTAKQNTTSFTQIGASLGDIKGIVTASRPSNGLGGNIFMILNNDDVYAFGANNYGALGNNSTSSVSQNNPIKISGNFGKITDIIATGENTYLLAAPPTATVTVTPNDSDYGTVSPASITDIEPGDTITIANNTITYGETIVTATPAEADAQYTYAFSGFVDSNSDPVTGTVTVNSDMAITAVFTATTNQYAVTISPNDPSYGSVSPSSLTVDYGTAITVSGASLTIGSQAITATASDATAQYTYAFDSWTVPGAVETVTGAITITGTFTATVNEYTVTIESADVTLGTVDVSEVQDVPYGTAITVSGDTITIGETVITATVIGDGLVTKWSVSDGATVTGDMTITASFVEPSSVENTLMGLLPMLLIFVLVITAAGGVFASGGDPESLIKLIICLAVGVIIISVFVLPIAGGL